MRVGCSCARNYGSGAARLQLTYTATAPLRRASRQAHTTQQGTTFLDKHTCFFSECEVWRAIRAGQLQGDRCTRILESIWIGSECQRIRKPNEAISFKESNAVCTYGAPWGTGDRVASRVTSAQIPTLERAQVMHGAGPASRTTLRADCRSLSNFSAR